MTGNLHERNIVIHGADYATPVGWLGIAFVRDIKQ
jgi:hypothetical protein